MEKISQTSIHRPHATSNKNIKVKKIKVTYDSPKEKALVRKTAEKATHDIPYAYTVAVIKRPVAKSKVDSLNITNLKSISNNSLRGETLSSKKNRWAIKKLRRYGIESVIDLREKYTSEKYPQMCKSEGLKYYNFPIDSHSISDDEIIRNFPVMFKVMNDGRYYISCAQGLHRTDIALALNYIFNPKAQDVPIMIGHYHDNMDMSDIARRINSISKKLNPEKLKALGWGKDADEEISKRKLEFVKSFIVGNPSQRGDHLHPFCLMSSSTALTILGWLIRILLASSISFSINSLTLTKSS